MAEPWFHRRAPDEGEGYGIRSRKALLSAMLVGAAVALAIILPVMAGAGAWTVYGIAVAVLLPALGLMAVAIKRHSD